MKTISVTLTQEPQAGMFRVVSFKNTCQLSIGQTIKHATLEDWCARPQINVSVIGMTPQVEDAPQLLDAQSILDMQELTA